MTESISSISLDEAKQLVALLEAGNQEDADAMVETLSLRKNSELFSEIGKLTRDLHDSLANFKFDESLIELTTNELPDAQSRLQYVIEETEKAANKTMDAVESSMPIVEALSERIEQVLPEWKRLMNRQIDLGEFKSLCHDLDGLLNDTSEQSKALVSLLTDVLMAQGYQDLTGQVIRRIITLVKEVEENLVSLLATFGDGQLDKRRLAKESDKRLGKEKLAAEAEGPIIDAAERSDVVQGQDDVDDLLSSLGF